jgi:hypothetical protein
MASADQIAIQIPEPRVKEGSAFTVTAYFRNRAASAAATTPTSVQWRLDCLETGIQIADWTSVTAAANVSLSITGTHNAIQSEANKSERKQLTIMLDEGLSTQYRETAVWTVENLYGSP